METIKKNIPLTIFCVICLVIFLAGAILTFLQMGSVSESKDKIKRSYSQIQSIRFSDPAPTDENVAASEANVDELKDRLLAIRSDFQKGAGVDTSEDGVQVMASIQRFISEFQNRARNNTDASGEAAPIDIPENFAFGFEKYIGESAMIDDRTKVPVMDKQRKVLTYLMEQLFASNPSGIVKVEREVLEQKPVEEPAGGRRRGRRGNAESQVQAFKIDPATTARVDGAIDTLAFSITFEGRTATLRDFLNRLSAFDLPIVVRSVDVKRASESTIQSSDASFDEFDTVDVTEEQKPIISEVDSTFTVVLEFIEIVLPSETTEEEAE